MSDRGEWVEVAREHARDESDREEAAAQSRRAEKTLEAYKDRKAIGDEATPVLNPQLRAVLGRECPRDQAQTLRAVYDLEWIADQDQGGVEGPLPADAGEGLRPESFVHLTAAIADTTYAVRARVLWMPGDGDGWQAASFLFAIDALHSQTPWSKIDQTEVITDYLSFARALRVPHTIVQSRLRRSQERARRAGRAQAAASFAVKVTGWPDAAYGATNSVTSLSNGSQTLRKLREQDENNPMSVTENWLFIEEGEAASSRDVTERDDAARLVTKIVNRAGREGLVTLTMDDGAQIVAPRPQWPLFRII